MSDAHANRSIEEVVQYAIGHRIRVETLILLNERPYCSTEIAKAIGVPLTTLNNHLRRMCEEGSIEIAKVEKRRNMDRYWYRAVEIKEYSVAEFERLPFRFRQNIAGAIAQSGIAEVMAALYAGTLADPRANLFWQSLNLDEEGRAKADAATEGYVKELQEIEVEATNRVAASGGETTSMLVNHSFFERARKGGVSGRGASTRTRGG
ncbi:MAG TPA: winged helix-turn-helix domain-containing protein [Solirubrobacterales bacterium]|nr:winged helix-turn-helix domain-containing protein [Solirubrobacterales bacterium]